MPNPLPDLFFDTIKAYQSTAALKSALELNLFTAIAEGHTSPSQLAQHCQSAERGIRILCDYLTVKGFLTKTDHTYALTLESNTYLNQNAPQYLGASIAFLFSDPMQTAFQNLTTAVKKGGTALSQNGTLAPEHPAWVAYAQSMAAVMQRPAHMLAQYLNPTPKHPLTVLDIAAGHGLFGLAFAQQNPHTTVTAIDWPNVLTVAQTHAQEQGLAHQFSTRSGNALSTEFGHPYDIAILANILHHFDPNTCIKLLKKVYQSLHPNGRVAILEFIPNPDRITPSEDAAFALIMLATTPQGDVYTYKELHTMCLQAGFSHTQHHALEQGEQQVVIGYK